MKLQVQASDLKEAFDIVSIVPPRPATPQGGTGYLFVVKDGKAFIYSRDALHQSRVDVAVDDSDDGAFVFPAERVGALKYLDGTLDIEAGHDAEDDRHWVRYKAAGGAKQEFSSFDPRLMTGLEEALEKATSEAVYPAGVLREGLNTTKSFLAKVGENRVEEHYQTLQLFDDSKDEWRKGNGTLYAADGVRICYFHCEAFQGKGLAIHGQHLGFLNSFLAKCSGDVTVRTGDGMSFAISSQGHVLGWSHHVKQHRKFAYYSLNTDKFILKAPKEILVKALRYVRAGLEAKRDRIRITYSHEDLSLRFTGSEGSGQIDSPPVGVKPITDDKEGGELSQTGDFAFNINVNQMLDLIEAMKSNEVELRVAVIPGSDKRKESGLFRTIEEFHLDAHGKVLIAAEDAEGESYKCRVTRFMPSRE